MIHARENPARMILHITCNTPHTRASATPTVKYTTHRKRAQGTAARARKAVLKIFIAFIVAAFLILMRI